MGVRVRDWFGIEKTIAHRWVIGQRGMVRSAQRDYLVETDIPRRPLNR